MKESWKILEGVPKGKPEEKFQVIPENKTSGGILKETIVGTQLKTSWRIPDRGNPKKEGIAEDTP